MQRTKSKILSILLSLVMLLSLLPTTALAAGEITTGNAKVTAPVAGQTPSFTATSDEPEKYSVELLRWIDVENSQDITSFDLTDPASNYYNYTFKGGKEYTAVVEFTAVGDNTVSYDNSFTINGETTYWTVNGLYRCHTFTATGTGGGEHTHTYNQETVKPEALKTPADCTNNAVYFKSCSCGAISTTDTFAAMGTALSHAYGSDWKYDSTNHWHECSRCHDKKDEAAHDYGFDSVCDTCGREGTKVYSATVADINITLPAGYTSNDINDLGKDRMIKFTNTGTETLYISEPTLSGTNASDFYVRSFGNHVVAPGNTNTTAYAIEPNIGLAPGTYTATISCTDVNNKLSVPVTAKVTLTVNDHNWDTSKWEFNPLTHWHKCTDSGCSAKRDEAAHNSDKVVDAKKATFDTDGYTGDKYCSICDRKMETGKAIAAGKYIRESKAKMTPAGINNTISANDLVFTSLDTSKYTVGLYRVFDMTDTTLNTVGMGYPHDKKFISGHKYAIEFEFEAVEPYVYDTMHGTHSSTFKLNDADTMMSAATTHAGSPARRVELVAGEVSVATSVSGTVLSWNNTNDALYYLYPSTMEDAAIKAEWKSGKYTGTACTSKGTPTASDKQFAQTFSFGTIQAGEYKLVIFKPEKYVPKIVPITVESTALDLGQLKLWLYGDVNYDGKVSILDAVQIQMYKAGKTSVFTDGSGQDIADRMVAANVTEVTVGDTIVNVLDAVQIQLYKAGKSSAFDSMK